MGGRRHTRRYYKSLSKPRHPAHKARRPAPYKRNYSNWVRHHWFLREMMHPFCWYCGVQVTYFEGRDLAIHKPQPNWATIEHRFTRQQRRDLLNGQEGETVLACYECNQDRSRYGLALNKAWNNGELNDLYGLEPEEVTMHINPCEVPEPRFTDADLRVIYKLLEDELTARDRASGGINMLAGHWRQRRETELKRVQKKIRKIRVIRREAKKPVTF